MAKLEAGSSGNGTLKRVRGQPRTTTARCYVWLTVRCDLAAAGAMVGGASPILVTIATWSLRCGRIRRRIERYASQDVPRLRKRDALHDDLRTMAGHGLVLEPAWRVLPDARVAPFVHKPWP